MSSPVTLADLIAAGKLLWVIVGVEQLKMGGTMGAFELYLVVGVLTFYISARKGVVMAIDRIAKTANTKNEHELHHVLERLLEPFTNPITLAVILVTVLPLYLFLWPIMFPLHYRSLVKMKPS